MSNAPTLAATRPAAGSHASPWATAALADQPDTSPGDLDALGDHASRCRGAQGRFHRTRTQAETVGRFFGSRLMTSLVAIGAALGLLALFA